jgi:hypothetical protein
MYGVMPTTASRLCWAMRRRRRSDPPPTPLVDEKRIDRGSAGCPLPCPAAFRGTGEG